MSEIEVGNLWQAVLLRSVTNRSRDQRFVHQTLRKLTIGPRVFYPCAFLAHGVCLALGIVSVCVACLLRGWQYFEWVLITL